METQTQGCKSITEQKAAKTAVVTLIPGIMETVIRLAHENKIAHELIGKDQNDSDIIKFNYHRGQQSVINSIYDYIRFFESLLEGLKLLAEPALKIINDELLLAYLKLKEEKEQQDLQHKTGVLTINKIADGNERGE